LGGFDDRLTVGEDWDFLDRARRAGHAIWFDPSFAVRHQSNRDTPEQVCSHARWYADGYVRLLAAGRMPGGRWRAERLLARIKGGATFWSAVKATLALIRVVLPHPSFWRCLRGVPGAWLFYYARRREVFRRLAELPVGSLRDP
jgi:GT2 family glycosyltransferase